ncbi:hypothetical protein [Bosea sp. (in: a-proteobacteria)]|uniref:spike base protein, RCAP_Rcc01079 family n=1 Tax=Bosea sp. (in: a-proteobacteria) TaxID=1871050 RepID=UPI00261DC3EF|nr:hypothetical protein [Bosea sp. (in: a-proteobacteria)]MCO5092009.1 hypothetical protein [Bosea sp. (in: a-proteobacteria)]
MPVNPAKRPKTSSQAGLGNPARRAFAITPADAELDEYTTALYVGGDGNLVVVLEDNADGEIVTFAVSRGYHPLCCRQVRAATTATGIVGLVG